jgi:hypothetical protein
MVDLLGRRRGAPSSFEADGAWFFVGCRDTANRVTFPECTHDSVDMAAPRCPQMSAPAPDGTQDPELLSMHNGRTGAISASGGAGYPDRLSMLCSAQKVWSVPLQPHDPELVARPFGTNNTVLPDLFRHRGDERSDSVRLQTSLLLDDCKHGGGLHHSENHISGIRLLDACSRPGEECFIEMCIKGI